ncbi:MAG TPA: threonylcarbamoyl-AMP synthase [Thermoplasmatales archaeon]|nr:threonylcarbamoyl-AMP synthase [Thermoplasmatales archaeon]
MSSYLKKCRRFLYLKIEEQHHRGLPLAISLKKNDSLTKAYAALKKGKLIVYPTDTLYALGADIFNEGAVRKVYAVKERPLDEPLPVAVSDINMMDKIAFISKIALKLVNMFLPGPLTIVLPKKPIVPRIVTGNSETIAIRIPDNDTALSLISNYGPLTATSVNIHGLKPLTSIDEIEKHFKTKDIAVYIDQGELKGEPSTIVDLTKSKPIIIREGVIPKEQILSVVSNG